MFDQPPLAPPPRPVLPSDESGSPAPTSGGMAGMLAQIQKGSALKHVEKSSEPSSPPSAAPAGLLAGIKSRSSQLKHVSTAKANSGGGSGSCSGGGDGGGGMMAAILAKRSQMKHVDTDKTGIAKQAALSRAQGGEEANTLAAIDEPRPRARTKSNFRKSTFEGVVIKVGWLQKRSTGENFTKVVCLLLYPACFFAFFIPPLPVCFWRLCRALLFCGVQRCAVPRSAVCVC